MPKKIITETKTETVQETPADPEVPIEVIPDLDPEDDLASAISSLGPDSGIFKIEKYVNGTKQHCGRVDPSVLVTEGEDYILKQFGGGRYRVTGFRNGQYIKGTCRVFDIYTVPDPKAQNPGVPFLAPPSGLSPEIGLLREDIARQHELVLRLLESKKSVDSDGASIGNFIDALGKMQQLTPKAPDLSGVVDLMRLARETISSATDSGGWSSVVDNLLKAVPTIMGGLAAMKSTTQPQNPAVETRPAALQTEQAELQLLKQAIEHLKKEQRSGMPSDLVVAWISNHMDEPAYRNTAVLLLNRQFETLFQVDSEIEKEPLRSWFLRVYTDLRRVLIDEAQPSEQTVEEKP